MLLYLDNIKRPELLKEKDRAMYQYLHETALKRKNLPDYSDSLMQDAARLFRETNDSVYLIKAILETSNFHFSRGNYTIADSLLAKAYPYADKTNQAFILEYRGYCQLNQNKPQEALPFFFAILKDTVGLPLKNQLASLGNIGYAYRHMGETDSAIVYFQEVVEKATTFNMSPQISNYYKAISDTYKKTGNYKAATEALRLSYDNDNRRFSVPVQFLSKGLLYQAIGDKDSARINYQQAIQSTDMYVATQAYAKLAQLYGVEKSDSLAFSVWQTYGISWDNVQSAAQYPILQQKYKEEILRNEINELKLRKSQQDVYLLILCLIVLTLCSLGYIIYIKERKKKQLRKQQLKAQALEDQIDRLEQEHELISLRERATALREQLFRQMSVSQKIPSLAGEKGGGNNKNKSRLTWEEIEELVQTVSNIWPGFAERLRKTYPLLQPKDITFCCLIKAGITTKDLAAIYYVTPSAISKKKTRMKKEKFTNTDETLSLEEVLYAF